MENSNPKNLGFFYNFQKLPKVGKQEGMNSPNLVTLPTTWISARWSKTNSICCVTQSWTFTLDLLQPERD
jgi:hypothetical protein